MKIILSDTSHFGSPRALHPTQKTKENDDPRQDYHTKDVAK